jgi:hypothetical protein
MSVAFPEAYPLTLSWSGYCCHNRFFFDNVFEELSAPGEYYVNVTERTVYAIPPAVDSKTTTSSSASGSTRTTATATTTVAATAAATATTVVVASVLVDTILSFDATAADIVVANLSITVTRGSGIDAEQASRVRLLNLEVGEWVRD